MWNYAGLSDKGIRDINDDRILCGNKIISEGIYNGKSDSDFIAAVFDGVGGMKDGYRAAQLAAENLREYNRSGLNRSAVQKALENINLEILQAQKENNLTDGMRTTIAGIYADEKAFFVFNAGDSRIYRLRDFYFTRLSKDHSYVQELIDSGEITPEQARFHPKRNIIRNCLGHRADFIPRISESSGSFLHNDILLLCSDGLTDALSDEEIHAVLLLYSNLKECCLALYEAAMQNQAHDNISILLIQKKDEKPVKTKSFSEYLLSQNWRKQERKMKNDCTSEKNS